MTTGELKPKVFRESAIRNNGAGKIQFLRKSFCFLYFIGSDQAVCRSLVITFVSLAQIGMYVSIHVNTCIFKYEIARISCICILGCF